MGSVCLVYKITNSINDKVYVGQTWQPIKLRFKRHKSTTLCVKLLAAFNKHGRGNFQVEVLTVAHTQSVVDYWEDYFIKKYDSIQNGYNIREAGAHGKLSNETKKKLSDALTGVPKSKEHIANVATALKGHIISEETKRRISLAKKGKKQSTEHIAKRAAKLRKA